MCIVSCLDKNGCLKQTIDQSAAHKHLLSDRLYRMWEGIFDYVFYLDMQQRRFWQRQTCHSFTLITYNHGKSSITNRSTWRVVIR